MNAEKQIKLEARTKLKDGSWGMAVAVVFVVLSVLAVGATLLTLVALFMPSNENSLYSLYVFACYVVIMVVFFLLAPIYFSAVKWHYSLAKGEEPPLSTAFYYLESVNNYGIAVRYAVHLFLRYLGWGILSLALGIITFSIPFGIFASNLDFSIISFDDAAKLLEDAGIDNAVPMLILLALTIFFFFIFTRQYFMATYFFVSGDYEKSTKECILKSHDAMRNNKIKNIKLAFLFIPWFLLCFFIVPIFYVYPYYKTSNAISAKWIDEIYQETQSKICMEQAARATSTIEQITDEGKVQDFIAEKEEIYPY